MNKINLRKIYLIFSLLAVFIFHNVFAEGYGAYDQFLKEWEGAKVKELLETWGYPDSIQKLPGRRKVYKYVHSHQTTVNNSGFSQVVTVECRTWFEVNKQNIITNTEHEGDGCEVDNDYRWAPDN